MLVCITVSIVDLAVVSAFNAEYIASIFESVVDLVISIRLSPGINLTKITFKNVPAALWADETALITAANIPNGTVIQVDNYI